MHAAAIIHALVHAGLQLKDELCLLDRSEKCPILSI